MNETSRSASRVALVATDAAGITVLGPAREILDRFDVPWLETIAAVDGQMPLHENGSRAIIVASADAALPAALASNFHGPVVRVPTPASAHEGTRPLVDPATENLPGPAADAEAFATMAIGEAGARNAALFVVCVAGLTDARLWAEWLKFRQQQTDAVLGHAPLDAL